MPHKQPKQGRLWLNDVSCVRLRPEHRDHVWSYDFVESRTHDGRKFRMLNIIDEFTRECLAIRIDRKLNSTSVVDALTDLFILRGVPDHIRSDNGPELLPRQCGSDRRRGCQNRIHRAGQPMGERLLWKLQRPTVGRTPQRRDLLLAGQGEGRDRKLAPPL